MKPAASAKEQKINNLDEALSVIMDAIVTQALPPGQKVSENILSERFGISRTMSRNLIERLIARRFLTTVSERVTQVAPLTLLDIRQNFVLRKMLLTESFSLASTKLDHELLEMLHERIEARLPITDDSAALEILKLNKKLNIAMCESSNYPLMLDWAEQLEDMAMRIYWLHVKITEQLPYSSEQHAAFIKIVRKGDPTEIRRLVYDLMSRYEDKILDAIFSLNQLNTQNLTL